MTMTRPDRQRPDAWNGRRGRRVQASSGIGAGALKRHLFVIGAALCATGGARAQDKPATGPQAEFVKQEADKQSALSRDIAATLAKSGFTDLQIMPNSVLVRGKDKTGQPVAMILNPGSMTEVVTLDPHSGSAAGGNGAPDPGSDRAGKAPLTGSGTFATVLPTERLASILIGLKVRNAANDEVGTIRDLAIDHDGVQAYILAVGGVLGLGNRYVAVTPAALAITYDPVGNIARATMEASTEQMKAAPPFLYDGPFKASRD